MISLLKSLWKIFNILIVIVLILRSTIVVFTDQPFLSEAQMLALILVLLLADREPGGL